MSTKNLTSPLIILFIIGLLFSFSTYAQLPPGFGDDVDDETPAAPIDGLLGLGLVAGTVIAYNKFKNLNHEKKTTF